MVADTSQLKLHIYNIFLLNSEIYFKYKLNSLTQVKQQCLFAQNSILSLVLFLLIPALIMCKSHDVQPTGF